MLSERQILDRLPIARSTLQHWEKEGLFPKSIPIGPNRKAWYKDEVVAWQKQRERTRATSLLDKRQQQYLLQPLIRPSNGRVSKIAGGFN
jgi:predicted DNA-binding transcriptional regulator AlpA